MIGEPIALRFRQCIFDNRIGKSFRGISNANGKDSPYHNVLA
jgi:hypothetical protein